MAESLVLLGFVVVVIGIILIAIGSTGSKEAKFGIGGFIGPVPFGFGNDPQMAKIAIIVSVIAAVLFAVLFLRGVL